MDTTTAAVDQFCAGLKVAAKESCLGQAHLYEQTYYWKSAALLLALAAERDALREAVQDATKLLESFYGDSGPGGSVYKILKAALVAMEKP